MSSAHRPTWAPAQGKGDNRHASKITSVRDLPGQTTLKYRERGGDDRDVMRRQLARAERDARNKKRKAEGLAPEEESSGGEGSEGEENDDDEGVFKKPKLIQRQGEDEDEGEEAAVRADKGKAVARDDDDGKDEDDDDEDADSDDDDSDIEARAREILKQQRGDDASDDEDDDEDEDDDDSDADSDDETAQLMRELEKIKAERAAAAAEKQRQEEAERERREEEIARGNPLLNHDGDGADGDDDSVVGGGRGRDASATPFSESASSTMQPSFGVKRRWDDGECACARVCARGGEMSLRVLTRFSRPLPLPLLFRLLAVQRNPLQRNPHARLGMHAPRADVIFKNQSAGSSKTRTDFVNDLTRTEFHKEFMHVSRSERARASERGSESGARASRA